MPVTFPFGGPAFGDNAATTQNTLQTLSASLSVDSTTTSTTFSNLLVLSASLTNSSNLLIWIGYTTSFSAGVANNAMLRLTIDGVEKLRSGEEEWTAPQSGAIVYRATGLSSGSHGLALQWRIGTAGDGTFRCRPSVEPEGASMVIMEVSV